MPALEPIGGRKHHTTGRALLSTLLTGGRAGRRLVCGGWTEVGGRQRNEDFGAWRWTDYGVVVQIADGIGGGKDGALFSRSAVVETEAGLVGDEHGAALFSGVERALTALYQIRRDKPEYSMSGTTLVAASLRPANQGVEAIVVAIGDSRAYRVTTRGKATQLTRDHTYAEALISRGWPAERARAHPQARRITHVVGDKLRLATVPHAVTRVWLRPGERLILCTDGVSKTLSPAEIGSTVRNFPPQRAAQRLVAQAASLGSRDNMTALVVSCPVPRASVALVPLIALATLLCLLWAAQLVLVPGGPPGLVGGAVTPMAGHSLSGDALAVTRSSLPNVPGGQARPSPTPMPTVVPTPYEPAVQPQ